MMTAQEQILDVRVGRASRPRPGEDACGDQVGVWTQALCTTIVVADGLGHGSEAELAARRAVEVAGTAPHDRRIENILKDCHAGLAGTRGAAVTIVRVDARESTLEHVGVGNVELVGRTYRAVRPVLSPGIVGARLRNLVVSLHRLYAGDLLAIFTDGLYSNFTLDRFRSAEPQAIAEALLAAHAKNHDDASCVVVRV